MSTSAEALLAQVAVGESARLGLDEVACSEALVVAALGASAAEAGATELVAPRCARGGRAGERLRCAARAGAAPTGSLGARRSSSVTGSALGARGDQRLAAVAPVAWASTVRLRPLAVPAWRAAQASAEQVSELLELPASQLPLAEVRLSCGQGCSPAAARAGLRVVAAWLGADSVVGPHCEGAARPVCTATLAAYEVDPRMHPAAR